MVRLGHRHQSVCTPTVRAEIVNESVTCHHRLLAAASHLLVPTVFPVRLLACRVAVEHTPAPTALLQRFKRCDFVTLRALDTTRRRLLLASISGHTTKRRGLLTRQRDAAMEAADEAERGQEIRWEATKGAVQSVRDGPDKNEQNKSGSDCTTFTKRSVDRSEVTPRRSLPVLFDEDLARASGAHAIDTNHMLNPSLVSFLVHRSNSDNLLGPTFELWSPWGLRSPCCQTLRESHSFTASPHGAWGAEAR